MCLTGSMTSFLMSSNSMKNKLISLLMLAAASLVSCESGGDGGPVKLCEKVGQQCVFAPGKLGVCQFDASQKLACMSQH